MAAHWRTLAVVAVAGLYFGFAVTEIRHLLSGFDISVSLGDGAPTTTHVSFPSWRKLAPIVPAALLATGLGLWLARARSATPISWLAFGAAVALRIDDEFDYGSIAAPMSLLCVLLLALTAIVVTLRRPGRSDVRTARRKSLEDMFG